jgi:hypothetical protein
MLESPRVRRRLLWAGGFFLLAGIVAGLIVAFPHPPKRAGEKTSPGGDIVVPDVPVSFKPHAAEVLGMARAFVMTAVARKHLASSYDFVCPEMKQGFTREKWAKGEIPVVPYPVFFGKWRVSYSFAREVDVQVALFAKPKSKVKPVVFDLALQPCGAKSAKGGRHWLVSSFIPVSSPSGDYSVSNRSGGKGFNPFGIGTRNPKPLPNTAGIGWLFVPLLVLGGTVFLVIGFLVIRSVRGRRAYSAHVRERQMSSSRPS